MYPCGCYLIVNVSMYLLGNLKPGKILPDCTTLIIPVHEEDYTHTRQNLQNLSQTRSNRRDSRTGMSSPPKVHHTKLKNESTGPQATITEQRLHFRMCSLQSLHQQQWICSSIFKQKREQRSMFERDTVLSVIEP